jgi:dipeptidyl aminopeptidase/acylaminoacyl peptidase
MSDKTTQPFGAWQSPITADLVAKAAKYLTELKINTGHIYWLERRPEEAGRQVIMQLTPQGQIKSLTPASMSVCNRVHEYGGGNYVVNGEWIYFANDQDQRWYRQKQTEQPEAITPTPMQPKAWRYADPVLSADGQWLIAVRESHHAHGVDNELVAIATDASLVVQVLMSGYDFYAAPRISQDGKYLAWLCWRHPQMPWDGTELWYGELTAALEIINARCVAGSVNESVCQPNWSPDGKLYFCSDVTGWWNIYYYDHHLVEPICAMSAEFGYPQWVFGTNTYAFIDAKTLAVIITKQGKQQIGVVNTNHFSALDIPFDSIVPNVGVNGDEIIFIGGNAAVAPALMRYDLTQKKYQILYKSTALAVDKKYLSQPQVIEFVSDDRIAHAFYYPPHNADYQAPTTEKPPLIVQSHGGPTASTSTELNLKIQFWTSRGFAVVDVNYGGSTGYGRAYRELLKGQWGIVDVADCVNAAKYLIAQGKADPKRLAIRGGSASGFTVLCALAFYDIFSVGASYYGVADLISMADDTHKFESHYLEKLIGKYPQEKALYEQRSPLHHADQLSCPIIFFQGLLDKVVPPAQTESMIAAMNKNKLPLAYLTFAQEAHGFRDARTIKTALEAELYFYLYFFRIKTSEALIPIKIENL